MNVQPKPLATINHRAIGLLTEELGVADTIRFISQFTTGHGNYTEERRAMFDGMSLDDVLVAMKADRDGVGDNSGEGL